MITSSGNTKAFVNYYDAMVHELPLEEFGHSEMQWEPLQELITVCLLNGCYIQGHQQIWKAHIHETKMETCRA